MWGRVGNYLGQYLILTGWYQMTREVYSNSSSTWRIIFQTPRSEAPLFVKGLAAFKETLISPIPLSLLLFEPPSTNFHNLHHLARNSTNCNYVWREEMSPFVFSVLLADAHVLSRLNGQYLLSIFAIHGFKDLCDICFLPFSRIVMAFSLPEVQYRVPYFCNHLFLRK